MLKLFINATTLSLSFAGIRSFEMVPALSLIREDSNLAPHKVALIRPGPTNCDVAKPRNYSTFLAMLDVSCVENVKYRQA
jgi:hypothetical protein